MKKLFILSAIVLLLASCSKRITVTLPPSSQSTGTITIMPVKKTIGTTVTLNDSLIVKKKKVKSLTIENVPVGNHTIQYNADNSYYQYPLDTLITVDMSTPKQVTKTVKVPPYSTGYYIYSGLIAIAVVILILL